MKIFTPMFFSKSLIVSALTYKSLVHFELFFIIAWGKVIQNSLFCIDNQLPLRSGKEPQENTRSNNNQGSHRAFYWGKTKNKKLFFPPLNALTPLLEINWQYVYTLLLDSQLYFTDLYVCLYGSATLPWLLLPCNKFSNRNVNLLILLFFFKVITAIFWPLNFHKILGSVCRFLQKKKKTS